MAVVFLAGAFFAVDFAVEVVLAAVVLRAGLDAVDLLADFLAAVPLLAVDFEAVDLAVADLVAVLLLAVVFLAGEDFFADDCLLAALLVVEAAFVVVDFAGADARSGVLAVALGSFLAPETTALRSAPGRNFGTAVFLARMRAPVWGLRTVRAGRMTFSKAPKPVMATFSPLVTSLVTVSSTASSA